MDFSSSFMFITTLVLLFPISIHSDDRTGGHVVTVRKHLHFPDFSFNQEDINLLGSATVSRQRGSIQIPDATKGDDIKDLAGRAIYASPVRLYDPLTRTPASFQTTFSFQFQNASSSDGNVLGGGSGLSFIIVPDEFTVGRPGPWLGILNDACDEEYKSIAVEFDTRQNPEFGDPNDNHVGINLGSIVSTKVINASESGVYLKDGSIHRAWISYDGQNRHLDIHLGANDKDCPTKSAFSGPLDLSPFLNEYMFIGFSASTGNHTQIHTIWSWNFTSTSQSSLRIPPKETCADKIMLENREGPPEGLHRKTPTSFLIFIAIVILSFAVLLNFYFSRRRRKDDDNSTHPTMLPEKVQRPRPPNKPRRFSAAEISNATRSFSEPQILGSDARSVTYKGILVNGCNVAAKRFLPQFFTSHGLDRRRVHKEIKAVSKIRHPNLVPVRGWCFNHQETIVVYDYIPNGSLDKWLYGVGVLPWSRRFKVVKDVAEGLSYLHSRQLAHKNVKTSSVFLDVSLRAVLGDFGFVLPSAESTRFESVVSQAVDVFEFGLVVLEVVAGRGRKSSPGDLDLLDLAWALHERNEKVQLVDRRMGSVVIMDQAIRVLEVGLLCTLNENKGRPTMEEVADFLRMEKPMPELPSSRPVSLFPYTSLGALCTGYNCAPFK